MYRFTLAQRIVAVIALGLLLAILANFINSEGWQTGSASTGFFPASPNGGAVVGQATLYAPFENGLSEWLVVLVWIVAIAIWAAGSLLLFRAPSPLRPQEPDETEL